MGSYKNPVSSYEDTLRYTIFFFASFKEVSCTNHTFDFNGIYQLLIYNYLIDRYRDRVKFFNSASIDLFLYTLFHFACGLGTLVLTAL